MSKRLKVGDLVTRVAPNTGYAQDFMKPGHNYRLTVVEYRDGNCQVKVVGSDGWFDGTFFRLATLDDAYNPAPSGDKALPNAKVDTSWRAQRGPVLPLVDDDPHPLAKQEGGDHYSSLPAGYQPYEIAHKLGLQGMEMNVLKYVIRHRRKNGAQDLRKAIHTLEVLLKLEYPNG